MVVVEGIARGRGRAGENNPNAERSDSFSSKLCYIIMCMCNRCQFKKRNIRIVSSHRLVVIRVGIGRFKRYQTIDRSLWSTKSLFTWIYLSTLLIIIFQSLLLQIPLNTVDLAIGKRQKCVGRLVNNNQVMPVHYYGYAKQF